MLHKNATMIRSAFPIGSKDKAKEDAIHDISYMIHPLSLTVKGQAWPFGTSALKLIDAQGTICWNMTICYVQCIRNLS